MRDNQVCLVTSLSTLIIMNSQSQHSNSGTIHVKLCICVLLSVVESKEGYPLGPNFKVEFIRVFVCCSCKVFVPDLGISKWDA
jgi:hypothetical protein